MYILFIVLYIDIYFLIKSSVIHTQTYKEGIFCCGTAFFCGTTICCGLGTYPPSPLLKAWSPSHGAGVLWGLVEVSGLWGHALEGAVGIQPFLSLLQPDHEVNGFTTQPCCDVLACHRPKVMGPISHGSNFWTHGPAQTFLFISWLAQALCYSNGNLIHHPSIHPSVRPSIRGHLVFHFFAVVNSAPVNTDIHVPI
jgi:hypothetical protein